MMDELSNLFWYGVVLITFSLCCAGVTTWYLFKDEGKINNNNQKQIKK